MLLLDNRGHHDPALNLALEEYAVRHLDPEPSYLLFYINEPSIIIGKNQSTLEEINHRYVEENALHVVRRISGGGAVYHDHGNLNFSFITSYTQGRRLDFQEFTAPVIAALHELDIPAELTGRNDIVVAGRKISGNAQFTTVRSMFSHGTLLFDTNLEHVVEALTVSIGKIESKGLKSVRSRVANIREFLDETTTVEEFRDHLLSCIFPDHDEPPTHRLDEAEWERVAELAEEKYRRWDWNYGASPEFNVQKKGRFDCGEIDLRIDVHKGVIRGMKIYGDFLGTADVAELESLLVGRKYEPGDLADAIAGADLDSYFGPIGRDDFLRHLY